MANADRQGDPTSGAAPGRASGSPAPHATDAAASPTPSPSLAHIGRYEVRGTVGQGGMGEVFEAWDPSLRRSLALKVMHTGVGSTGTQGQARFLDEAQIGGRLNHPGIVPVHDLGQDDAGRPYFTMRLVEGSTLDDILHRLHAGDDEWNLVGVLGVLLKVCQAMAFAHDHGVVHRDLKPANVMVGAYGEVYVMDWGLAHRLDEVDGRDLRPYLPEVTRLAGGEQESSPLLTREGDVIGTPAFMSPEQALGQVHLLGPATDVYAVGSILYYAASGCMPHVTPGERVTAGEVWKRVRAGPPTPLGRQARRLPPELIAICEKAMAREVTDRYADMGSLAQDLRAYLEGRVVSAHRTGAVAEARKWVSRNLAAALAITLSLSVVVVGSLATAAMLSDYNRELTVARDQAWKGRNDAVAALDRESAARSDAEAATRQAEVAKQRESVMLREAMAAAQRESDARQAAEQAEREARWQAQRANLSAASAHLALGDLGDAHARLSACDPALSGWEHDVLALRLDPALTTWSAGSPMWALAVAPGGNLVASGGSGQRLWLRDLVSGELLARPELTGVLRGLAFTPDGRRLVLAEGDASVTQRDANTGALLVLMRGHRGAVNAVATSADGTLIASASDDGSVRLWESATGEPLAVFEHGGPVESVTLAPDGETLASAGESGEIRLWSIPTGHAVATLAGQDGALFALAFDPAGDRLASGGADGRVRVWDWAEGRVASEHDAQQEILALCFSPSGERLLVGCGDGSLQRWTSAGDGAATSIGSHRAPVHAVAFTPDGAGLLSASSDGTVRLWDAATRPGPVRLPGHRGRVTCVAVSADGLRLATGSADHSVRVLDGRTGDGLHVLRRHTSSVLSVAFALDGRRLASSDFGGTIELWDTEQGEHLATLRQGTGRIAFVTASSDGRLLASAHGGRGNSAFSGTRLLPPLAGEREVGLWDAASGEPVGTLPGQAYGTTVVAFSGDGTRLVTGSQAGGLAVWDVAGRTLLRTLAQEPEAGHDPELPPVSFLAVDATGETIVSAHLSRLLPLVVWNGVTGERRGVLEGHDTRVWSVVLTPDGRRALSTGEDGAVRILDLHSGEHLLTLTEPGLTGLWLAMDRPGRRLLAPAHDGSLVVWDTDVQAARLLWQGAERREAASELAQRLLAEHVLPERALAALASGSESAGGLHDRVVSLLQDTPPPTASALNRAAWNVVRAPGASEAAYAGALLRSELAVARSLRSAALLNTLGLACYRAGQHERALEILTRADELNLAGGVKYPRAGDLVVAAMCLWRLGRPEDARAELDAAAASLRTVTDDELLALAREAQALVAGD